ncbi:MAG: hypothetical protein OXI25_01530, partial [Chloroflexota bacterium]|nr:hypothetical protein [Chloroflexota bacterium]
AARVRPTEIESVVVRAAPALRPWCEPLEERRRPPNPTSAANSILYGAAKGLANGQVVLADFTPVGLAQEEALRVAALTSCEVDDAYAGRAVVEVRTADGRVFTERVDTPLGHPSRPLSEEQLAAKFEDCAGYAACGLDAAQVRELLDALQSLEALADVRRLGDLARGGAD